MNTRIFLLPVCCIGFTGVLILGVGECARTPAVKVESSVSIEEFTQAMKSLTTLLNAQSTVDGACFDLWAVFDLEDREPADSGELAAKMESWQSTVQNSAASIKTVRTRNKEMDQLRESLSRYIDELNGLIQAAVLDLKSITRDPQRKP